MEKSFDLKFVILGMFFGQIYCPVEKSRSSKNQTSRFMHIRHHNFYFSQCFASHSDAFYSYLVWSFLGIVFKSSLLISKGGFRGNKSLVLAPLGFIFVEKTWYNIFEKNLVLCKFLLKKVTRMELYSCKHKSFEK